MAYIKVDYSKLERAASAVDTYVSDLRKNMRNIDNEIDNLNADWKGEDYNQVFKQWNEIDSKGSTTDKMEKSLENYSGALRDAARKYKDVQTRAENRACVLCR